MIEKLRPVRTALAATLMLLGSSACGIMDNQTGPNAPENTTTTSTAVAEKKLPKSPFDIEFIYENGTRLIRYGDDHRAPADTFQWCDGDGSLQQATLDSYYGKDGMVVIPGYGPCADGMLTEADFQKPQPTTTQGSTQPPTHG